MLGFNGGGLRLTRSGAIEVVCDCKLLRALDAVDTKVDEEEKEDIVESEGCDACLKGLEGIREYVLLGNSESGGISFSRVKRLGNIYPTGQSFQAISFHFKCPQRRFPIAPRSKQ
jgi:hypothetical protein